MRPSVTWLKFGLDDHEDLFQSRLIPWFWRTGHTSSENIVVAHSSGKTWALVSMYHVSQVPLQLPFWGLSKVSKIEVIRLGVSHQLSVPQEGWMWLSGMFSCLKKDVAFLLPFLKCLTKCWLILWPEIVLECRDFFPSLIYCWMWDLKYQESIFLIIILASIDRLLPIVYLVYWILTTTDRS